MKLSRGFEHMPMRLRKKMHTAGTKARNCSVPCSYCILYMFIMYEQICRIVYEKMQTLYDDAVEKLTSLELAQYIYMSPRVGTAIVNYNSTNITMLVSIIK